MPETSSEVYRAIDLSLRIGELLLSSGAGAADVAVTMVAVTQSCGLSNCVVDVNFSVLTISYQASPESAPETYVRVVQYRGIDYGYLAQADQLVRHLAAGAVDRAQASRRMNEIRSGRRPYPRHLVSLADGFVAAGIALLLGGGWLVVLIALVTSTVIDLANRQLGRRRIPQFYQQVAGALIATAVAIAVHLLDLPASPSLVIVSSIVVLLAGISFVGAIQDALTGYYLTGTARTFEAMLLTGGIIAGVSIGLSVAQNFGVGLRVDTPDLGASAIPVQLVGSLITTVAFALTCQVPRRALFACGMVGLFAQLLFQLAVQARLGQTASSSIAAFGVGLVAFSVARRVRIPPLVVVTTAIVALLPGLTIYRALFSLINENVFGVVTLLLAASIAVGLASGAILGEYIAQPLAREARRLENRLSGPRLVGPLRAVPRRTRRRARRALRKLQQSDDQA